MSGKIRKIASSIKPLSQKVIDKEKLENFENGLEAGDCIIASLVLVIKLKNTGAVRVRGKRELERINDKITKTNENYHYWVESKDLIFDDCAGIRKIYKKDEFYKNITDIEYAPVKNYLWENEAKILAKIAIERIHIVEKMFGKGFTLN